MASSFYDSDRLDWLGSRDDAQRRRRIVGAGLGFAAPGRELRLAVRRGERRVWWVRVAPDGSVLDVARTIPEGVPAGFGHDPQTVLDTLLERLPPPCQGFLEPVQRRLGSFPRAAVSAMGHVGEVPWEAEIDRYGQVRVTGAEGFADLLAAADDVVTELIRSAPGELLTLTEGPIGGEEDDLTLPVAPAPQPATGPALPGGPLPPDCPATVDAPGREIVLTWYERGTTRWAVWIGADGTVHAADGEPDWLRFSVPAKADDGRMLSFTKDPEGWLSASLPPDGSFWVGVDDVVRLSVAAPGVELNAGAYRLDVAVSAGGEVVVVGSDTATAVELLLASGLREKPFEALRDLAGMLHERTGRAVDVTITRGRRITPYTADL